MASPKNNTGTESNGGFKTAAFGFDKNDVNMYIAGLRKKMKSMEEEFEQKLAQALENPTASSDALKHEREAIRAETEKLWGEKLNERNNIIKHQQNIIARLEDELKTNKDKVASLRTQLSAATSSNNSDGAISARAAKAYMQFTRELRGISSTVEKVLTEMEQRWGGEFGETAAEIQAQQTPTDNPLDPISADISEAAANIPENPDTTNGADVNEAESASAYYAPVSENQTVIDESLLAEPLPEAPKPAPPKPAAVEESSAISHTAVRKAAAAPAHIPTPEPVPAPIPAAPKMDIDDDLSSLLADDMSELLVEPADNTVGVDADFEKLMASPDAEEQGDDLMFPDNAVKAAKGSDLDANLLSDIVINPDENPGDLNEMIKEKEISELEEFQTMFVTASDDEGRNDGLGIEVGNIEFGMESADDLSEKAKAAADNVKKEEDLFDFSFLISDDDEDDMSTDSSFSGML